MIILRLGYFAHYNRRKLGDTNGDDFPIRHALLYINISSVVEFQRWWVLKSKIFAVGWPGFKGFIWFFEMEEHGASEAHKNEFLNYEVLKI